MKTHNGVGKAAIIISYIFLAIFAPSMIFLAYTSLYIIFAGFETGGLDAILVSFLYASIIIAMITFFVFAFLYVFKFQKGNGAKYRTTTGIFMIFWGLIPGILILCSNLDK